MKDQMVYRIVEDIPARFELSMSGALSTMHSMTVVMYAVMINTAHAIVRSNLVASRCNVL